MKIGGGGHTLVSGIYNIDAGADQTEIIPKHLSIPEKVSGLAFIVFDGVVNIGSEEHKRHMRVFPIYIDPIKAIGNKNETYMKEHSSPAAWIGGRKRDELPDPYGGIQEDPIPEAIPEGMYKWLEGGDVGVWSVLKVNGQERLYSFFGDIVLRWDGIKDPDDGEEEYEEGPPFSAFRYIGSDQVFYTDLEFGKANMLDYYHEQGTEKYFFDEELNKYPLYPKMEPVLLSDGFPFDLVRPGGSNRENSIFYWTPTYQVGDCHESGSETVYVQSAFQFENEDKVYLWMSNFTDWGFGETLLDTKYSANYLASPPQYYSYITEWYPGDENRAVDDLGRTVIFKDDGPLGDPFTSFVIPSVWVVDRIYLSQEEGHYLDEEGILVWHTGRYRQSYVYLSYALKDDVLKPYMYMHFGGFQKTSSGEWIPRWVQDESEAVPVIRDMVGELYAMENPYTGKYNVFYHVNNLGQRGVVMREADFPWGPYSDKYLIVDATQLDEKIDSMDGEFPGLYEDDKLGTCYGGYTHPALWDYNYWQNNINIRYNLSFWDPYKVLLVETQMPCGDACRTNGFGILSASPFYLSTDLDMDNGGFVSGTWHQDNSNSWEHGEPEGSGGPGSCHGGEGRCWGTNLDGPYSNCEDSHITYSINLSDCQGSEETVYLVYWHWFSFENNDTGCDLEYSDGYTMLWSGDGGETWTQPETSSFISGGHNTSSINAEDSSCSDIPELNGLPGYQGESGGFERVVVPVPADLYTDEFTLRFSSASDNESSENHGVYIDDICLAMGDHNLCD